jgi:hypothetical protein
MITKGISAIKNRLRMVQKNSVPIIHENDLKFHANEIIYINNDTLFFLKRNIFLFRHELVEYKKNDIQKVEVVYSKPSLGLKMLIIFNSFLVWKGLSSQSLQVNFNHPDFIIAPLLFVLFIIFFYAIFRYDIMTMKITLKNKKELKMKLTNRSLINKDLVCGKIIYELDKPEYEDIFTIEVKK